VRVRIRYTKSGKVKFISHRDLARVFERAIHRAEIPVVYSQGFTPRPRLQFGLALANGYESDAEYLDIEIDDERLSAGGSDMAAYAVGLPGLLAPHLPTGVVVTAATELEQGTPSLQDAVTSCGWDFDFADTDAEMLAAEASRLLAESELFVELERKGKQVREDLRPLLRELTVERRPSGALLRAELGTKPRSVRPAELLAAMRLDERPRRVLRTHQWITADSGRREPIELDPLSPHALERAS